MIDIPVLLRVTGAPDIDLSTDTLDFAPVFVGATTRQVLTLRNIGTDLLSIDSIVADHSDYIVETPVFDLEPGNTREISLPCP